MILSVELIVIFIVLHYQMVIFNKSMKHPVAAYENFQGGFSEKNIPKNPPRPPGFKIISSSGNLWVEKKIII